MIELLLTMALTGLLAYLLVSLIPMPGPVRTVIIAAAVLFCVLLLVRAFGIEYPLPRR